MTAEERDAAAYTNAELAQRLRIHNANPTLLTIKQRRAELLEAAARLEELSPSQAQPTQETLL